MNRLVSKGLHTTHNDIANATFVEQLKPISERAEGEKLLEQNKQAKRLFVLAASPLIWQIALSKYAVNWWSVAGEKRRCNKASSNRTLSGGDVGVWTPLGGGGGGQSSARSLFASFEGFPYAKKRDVICVCGVMFAGKRRTLWDAKDDYVESRRSVKARLCPPRVKSSKTSQRLLLLFFEHYLVVFL